MTSDDQKERLREEVRVSLEIVENLTGVECPLNMISMLVLKLKLAQSRREWHQAWHIRIERRNVVTSPNYTK